MRRQDLEELTIKHSGCRIASYADITSGVTLLSGLVAPVGQEVLDRLCKDAALRLGGVDQPPLGVQTCPMAIKVDGDQLIVFLRDPEDETCALNLVCDHTVSLPEILNDAASLLETEVEEPLS